MVDELSVDRATYPTYGAVTSGRFQNFCAELLGKEDGIATSDVYGRVRQIQYGIDIKAFRQNGDGIEVGQCKAYTVINANGVKTASDEFLKHWDAKWKDQNIKRFILFVACPMTDRKVQDQIDVEKKRFEAIGVVYEAWSNSTITIKLRPHRAIAQSYLDDPYPDRICGKATISSAIEDLSPQPLGAILLGQIESLVTDKYEAELSRWKDEFKKGKSVLPALRSFKDDSAKWNQLAAKNKLNIVRFECRVLLSDAEKNKAEIQKVFQEAESLSNGERDICLESLIALRLDKDSSKALEKLEGATTPEALNLKAALLIEDEQFFKAKEVLSLIPENPVNSEKCRLKAYLCLMEKDFSGALSLIDQALKVTPDLPSLLAVKGKAYFYKSFSEGTLGAIPVSYPLPIHPSMLQTILDVKENLLAALGIFEKLHNSYEGELKESYSIWYFAILCLIPERREEAKKLLGILSEVEFKNSIFVSWLFISGLEFSISSFEEKLDKYIPDNPLDLSAVTARLLIHNFKAEYEKAKILLEFHKSSFVKAKLLDRFEHWQMELQIRSIKKNSDVENIKNLTLSSHLRALLIEKWINISPNNPEILSYCKQLTEVDDDVTLLHFVSEVSQKYADWQFIIDKAETLLTSFPTPSTLEMVALACSKAGRFDLTDKYIGQYEILAGNLTRHLLAEAKKNLGDFSSAISQAERNFSDLANENNFMFLANLLISSNDLPSLKAKVEANRGKLNLRPKSKIFLAAWLSIDFPEQAKLLIREVLKTEVPDDLVTPLLDISYELGMDDEISAVIVKMQEIALQGNTNAVKALSTKEAKKIIIAQRENYYNAYKLFQRAEIPIHMFATKFKFSLANYFLLNFKQNEEEKQSFRKAPIYAQYGGRVSEDLPIDIKQKDVCLDITSLFFFEHFDLMAIFEETVKTVVLPHETLHLLAKMRKQLASNQKSRFETCEKVVELCELGKIKKFSTKINLPKLSKKTDKARRSNDYSYLVHAKSTSGYLLDFSPLDKKYAAESNSFLKKVIPKFIGCGDVLDAAFNSISYATDEKEKIKTRMGAYANERMDTQPQQGEPIILGSGVVGLLQSSGLLAKVVSHYELWISEDEYEVMKSEIVSYRNSEEVSGSIQKLADKISNEIRSGKYRILPYKAPPDIAEITDLESAYIFSFLSVSSADAVLGICDDRFINGHPSVGEIRLSTFTEIAQYLRKENIIDEQKFLDVLLKLRSVNARFIRLDKNEILNYSGSYKEDEGLVINPNLSALRKYMFGCLVDIDAFQTPPFKKIPAFPHAELSFFLDSVKPVIKVIAEIWCGSSSEREKSLKSELLLDELYLDNVALASLFRKSGPPINHLQLYAHSIFLFFMEVMSSLKKEGRAEYLQWVEDRLLLPALDPNPELLSIFGDMIISFIMEIVNESPDERRNSVKILYSSVYQDFPEKLKQYLNDNCAQEIAKIGINVFNIVDIAQHKFQIGDFLKAVNLAHKDKIKTVTSIEEKQRIHIKLINSLPHYNILVDGEQGDKWILLSNSDLVLFGENFHAIEKYIKSCQVDLDIGASEIDKVISHVAGEADLVKRSNIWQDYAVLSYNVFLQDFKNELNRRNLSYNKIIPRLSTLLHFLRTQDVARNTTSIADLKFINLKNIYGSAEALNRILGTPLSLDSSIEDLVVELDELELNSFIKSVLRSNMSPPSMLHLIRLLSSEKKLKTGKYKRLRSRLLNYCLSENYLKHIESFLSVLRWVDMRLQTIAEYKNLGSKNRVFLAWIIAHHAYLEVKDMTDWIRELFGEKLEQRFSTVLFSRESMLSDVANPSNFTVHQFIACGLSYALNGKNELTASQVQRVNEIFLVGSEESKALRISLFRSLEEQSNHLGSFLSRNPARCFEELVNNSTTVASTVHEIGGLLNSPESNNTIWGLLEVAYGKCEVPLSLRSKLTERLKSTDFVELFKSDLPTGLQAYRFACIQSANIFSEDLRKYLRGQAYEIVRYLSQKDLSNNSASLFPTRSNAHSFLEALIRLSVHSDNVIENIKEFSLIIKNLSGAEYRVLMDFRLYIEKMFWDLPLEYRACFGPLVALTKSV